MSFCSDLITQKGEALGTALACAVVEAYRNSSALQKRSFFERLLTDFDVDDVALGEAISTYQKTPGSLAAQKVGDCAESLRQRVFRGGEHGTRPALVR